MKQDVAKLLRIALTHLNTPKLETFCWSCYSWDFLLSYNMCKFDRVTLTSPNFANHSLNLRILRSILLHPNLSWGLSISLKSPPTIHSPSIIYSPSVIYPNSKSSCPKIFLFQRGRWTVNARKPPNLVDFLRGEFSRNRVKTVFKGNQFLLVRIPSNHHSSHKPSCRRKTHFLFRFSQEYEIVRLFICAFFVSWIITIPARLFFTVSLMEAFCWKHPKPLTFHDVSSLNYYYIPHPANGYLFAYPLCPWHTALYFSPFFPQVWNLMGFVGLISFWQI